MKAGFSVYPMQCSAECETLNNTAQEMLIYKNQLESVKNRIAGLNGSGYGNVIRYLGGVIGDVASEQKNIELLHTVLMQTIQLYMQTDAAIADGNINGRHTDGENESDEDTWDDYLARILKEIGDIRGTDLGAWIETILNNGIFTDYVLSDIKKLLSGTYLTSYWKDGQMYFKLHFDELTNSQAVDWLKQNLGGDWDDYLARNLKRDGFSVFDAENGITRNLRYFDDVTDQSLLNYLETMKTFDELAEAGKFSFGQVFASNFNLLDDFNYKDFKNLGTLGKVGKVLGTVGTVLDLGGDVIDNFYDSENGTWDFSGQNIANCTCDVGIDLASGAETAALGATIGSFIGGPVGTVVGAGAGIAVDVVVNNWKIADADGDGEKDCLIDIAKIEAHKLADTVVDWGSDAIDAIGDWGSDACDWIGAAFSF